MNYIEQFINKSSNIEDEEREIIEICKTAIQDGYPEDEHLAEFEARVTESVVLFGLDRVERVLGGHIVEMFEKLTKEYEQFVMNYSVAPDLPY